jgi:ribosome maturation factor RimP
VTLSRSRLRDVLNPVVTGAGFDLEDVTVTAAGRRSVVRVVVDRDGGLDLDAVAEVSRDVSAVLDDADDVLRGAYVLEVTSPGVDRPLTAPRHWRRNRGRKVKVIRTDGREVVGRLVDSADDEAGTATLETDRGQVVLRYAEVRKATVEVEFSASGSSSGSASGSASGSRP